MSLFGSIARMGKKALGAASSLSKMPMVGGLLKAVPFVGAGLTAVDLATSAMGAFGGGGKGGAIPGGGMGGLPMLGGASGGIIAPGQTGGFGLPRGAGGRLQLPWNDPRIPEMLKQFALDDSFLKVGVRAPKGYVVIHDAQGRPFAVLKSMARHFRIWKPKAKPPISVREWHALQHAHSTVKKLRKVVKMANKIKGVHVGGHAPAHHHGGKKK